MKAFGLLCILISSSAFAGIRPTIICEVDGFSYKSSLQNPKMGSLRRAGCEEKFVNGSVCFQGDREKILELIGEYNLYNFLGPSKAFANARTSGASNISYAIDSRKVTIKPCR